MRAEHRQRLGMLAMQSRIDQRRQILGTLGRKLEAALNRIWHTDLYSTGST